LGLADLSDATPRRYGGAGLALGGPSLAVSCRKAGSYSQLGFDLVDRRTRGDVDRALTRLARRAGPIGCSLTLERAFPQHVGLGSKTALLLAVLRSVDVVLKLQLTKRDLQSLSGRGGSSGIGIHTFFVGGVVADGGHASAGEQFRPSSAASPSHELPPLNVRLAFPSNWRITLVLPRGARQQDRNERHFFQAHTPIPDRESLETVAWIYHGLTPAFSLGDLTLLGESVRGMSRTGFKKREILGQPQSLRSLLRALHHLPECAAGMSSMGPIIFVIHEAGNASIVAAVRKLADNGGAHVLGSWRGRNLGASIALR